MNYRSLGHPILFGKVCVYARIVEILLASCSMRRVVGKENTLLFVLFPSLLLSILVLLLVRASLPILIFVPFLSSKFEFLFSFLVRPVQSDVE